MNKEREEYRIQTKPYPAGEAYLGCKKPDSTLCELRNAAELVVCDDATHLLSYCTLVWECRPPSRRWRWWFYDHLWSKLERLAAQYAPMRSHRLRISVRLNHAEVTMLIEKLREIGAIKDE